MAPGYLENYGAGEAKRERLIKGLVLGAVLLAVAAGVGWYLLRNHKEDASLQRFVELLKNKDYPAGYAMWGCTVEKPCRDYSYDRFLEDWGNKGPHADASQVTVEKVRTCIGGVIRRLKYPSDTVVVFVNRADLQISFPPWGEACEVRVQVPAQ